MQYTQNSKPNPIWTCFHSLANDLAGLGLEQSLRWAEAGPNLDFLLSCIYNFKVMRVYSGTEELLHFTIVAVNGARVIPKGAWVTLVELNWTRRSFESNCVSRSAVGVRNFCEE